MMKRIIICILMVLGCFMLIYHTGCAQGENAAGVDAGDKAADFTLKDIKGNDVSLGDYIGKQVILLVFSATWCPACNREIPELKRIHSEYGSKGLKIVDVYIQESREKISKFVENNAIPYTIALDLDGKVAQRYKVYGIPTLIIIDKQGIIKERSYPPASRLVPIFEKLL